LKFSPQELEDASNSVVLAVKGSSHTFRTVPSLASQLNLPVTLVEEVVELLLSRKVLRRPYASTSRHRNMFTLASKPPSWSERYNMFISMYGD